METRSPASGVEAFCSFRDPDGFVFENSGRVFRCVYPHAAETLRSFLATRAARTWLAERLLSPADIISEDALPCDAPVDAGPGALFLEHQPIWFRNFPYEWSPAMLRFAGETTLRLAREALAEGFGLKDATPYNLMFDGPRPVFIDLLSFERRDPLDPLWPAYAQFLRTFVYPLIAARHCGARVDELLLVHRDGIAPGRLARSLGVRRWLPPFLGSVALPALLSHEEKLAGGLRPRRSRDAREARFILNATYRKALRLLACRPAPSGRKDYMEAECVYSASEMRAKENAIEDALAEYHPRSVLDVGCNTGHFSILAARAGADVVAIDRDPDAVDAVWNDALSGWRILPLVVDIARPAGACGWANSEFPSFLDRAERRFDAVMILALMHHLVVNERVPLERIFALAARLTRRLLVMEYIDPADPRFRAIARGRDALHRGLTVEAFEMAACERFEIAGCRKVTPTRIIYTLERKSA